MRRNGKTIRLLSALVAAAASATLGILVLQTAFEDQTSLGANAGQAAVEAAPLRADAAVESPAPIEDAAAQSSERPASDTPPARLESEAARPDENPILAGDAPAAQVAENRPPEDASSRSNAAGSAPLPSPLDAPVATAVQDADRLTLTVESPRPAKAANAAPPRPRPQPSNAFAAIEEATAFDEAPVPPPRPNGMTTRDGEAASEASSRRVAAPRPTPVATTVAHTAASAPVPPSAATPPQPAAQQNDDGPAGFVANLFSNLGALAYASPEGTVAHPDGTRSDSRSLAKDGVAVYDISAKKVYLPGGGELDAHSGLGPYKDDPDHVHLRMRGSTPPGVYDLKLRETIFHGVEALRLNPVSGTALGRVGLLAHSCMLGGSCESNGCVSFLEYAKFLRLFKDGAVTRLVVVTGRGSGGFRNWLAKSSG